MSLLLSASTNPPQSKDLLEYINILNDANVDYIHCDVMDGKFVPNKTIDHKTVGKINKITHKPLDVHLMVQKPWRVVGKYIKNGADIISVHYEAFDSSKLLQKTLCKIRRKGAFASIVINPSTQIKDIESFLPYCDMVLVMSVEPGKSGQIFIPQTLQKLEELQKVIKKQGINLVVEVDGGVNLDNAPELKSLGANIIVMGMALYSSENKLQLVEQIHNL